MTHPNNPDLLNTVLQLLTTQVTTSLAEGLRLLLNEAMRQERSAVLQAQPYERSDEGEVFAAPVTVGSSRAELIVNVDQRAVIRQSPGSGPVPKKPPAESCRRLSEKTQSEY